MQKYAEKEEDIFSTIRQTHTHTHTLARHPHNGNAGTTRRHAFSALPTATNHGFKQTRLQVTYFKFKRQEKKNPGSDLY